MYYYDSPMGVMKLCADEESLLGVWFDEERIAEMQGINAIGIFFYMFVRGYHSWHRDRCLCLREA